MYDLAVLGLEVRSDGVVTASQRLRELGGASQTASAAAAKMTTATERLAASMKRLAAMTAGVFAFDKAIEAAKQIDRLTKAYTTIAGSTSAANKQMQFLYETSNKLGLQFQETAESAKTFFAAGKGTSIEKDLNRIFKAVSSAGVALSLSQQEMNGVFLALGQMISKGTVQAEELRGQLGERLPSAFHLAAKAMNMTTGELDKFMAQGKLVAGDFLPKFAAALEEKFASPAENAAKGVAGVFNRISSEITKILASFINSDDLSATLKPVADWLKVIADNSAAVTRATSAVIKNIDVVAIGLTAYAGAAKLAALWTGTTGIAGGLTSLVTLLQMVAARYGVATAATTAFSMATGALKAALLAVATNPFVWVAGAAASIYYLTTRQAEAEKGAALFDQALKGLNPELRESGDAAKVAAENIAKMGEAELIAAMQKMKTALEQQRKELAGTITDAKGLSRAFDLDPVKQQISSLRQQVANSAITVVDFEKKMTDIARANPSLASQIQHWIELARKIDDNTAAVQAGEEQQKKYAEATDGMVGSTTKATAAASDYKKVMASLSELSPMEFEGKGWAEAYEYLVKQYNGTETYKRLREELAKQNMAAAMAEAEASVSQMELDTIDLAMKAAALEMAEGQEEAYKQAKAKADEAVASLQAASSVLLDMKRMNGEWKPGGLGKLEQSARKAEASLESLNDKVKAMKAELEGGKEASYYAQLEKDLKKYETAAAKATGKTKKQFDELIGKAKEYGTQIAQKKAFDEADKALQDFERQYRAAFGGAKNMVKSIRAEMDGYRDAVRASNKSELEKEAILKRILELEKELKLQASQDWGDGVTRAFKKYKEEVENLGAQAESTFTSLFQGLDNAGKSMWQKFIETGKLSMSSLKDVFNNFLAELAHMALTKPILLNIAGSISGLFGGGGATAGGVLDASGNIGGISGLMGIGSAIAGIGTSIGSVATSLFDGTEGTTKLALQALWEKSFGGALDKILPESVKDFAAEMWQGGKEFFGLSSSSAAVDAAAVEAANQIHLQSVQQAAYADAILNGATELRAAEIGQIAYQNELSVLANDASVASDALGTFSSYMPIISAIIASLPGLIKGDYASAAIAGGSAAIGTYAGIKLGSVVGPWGSLIGAGIGSTLGAVGSAIKDGTAKPQDVFMPTKYTHAWVSVFGDEMATAVEKSTEITLQNAIGFILGGDALNIAINRIFGKKQSQPAVSAWMDVNLTGREDYTDSTAFLDANGVRRSNHGTDLGYAEIMTKTNKNKSNLLEASEALFTAMQEVAAGLVQNTATTAELMPETISDQWMTALEDMPLSVYRKFKGSSISSKKFTGWLESLQEETYKVWVKAFQEVDFSGDWEYAGLLEVDQGLQGLPAGLSALEKFETLSGVDALHALDDATFAADLKKVSGISEMLSSIQMYAKYSGGIESLIAEVETRLGETLDGLSGVDVLKAVEASKLLSHTNENGQDVGPSVYTSDIAKQQASFDKSVYASGREGFDRFIAALQGKAMLDAIIAEIKDPTKELTEWQTAATEAVEQMRQFREEYLENTGWTTQAMDDMMDQYREAYAESFMEQIRDAVDPLTELQQSVKDQVEQIEDWIATMDILGASEKQLAEIEQIRAGIQDDLLQSARDMVNPMSQMAQATLELNTHFDDLAKALEIAGGSVQQITELEKLRSEALRQQEYEMKSSFYDGLRLEALSLAGKDTGKEQLLQQQKADRVSAANTFGDESAEYDALLAVQNAQRLDYEAQLRQADLDRAKALEAEYESQLKSARESAESARKSFVEGLISALDTAHNGIKDAVDAWVNGAQSAFDSAANAYSSKLQSTQKTFDSLADTLRAMRRSLWVDDTLSTSAASYSTSRAEMDRLYALAMTGDTSAASDFSSIAKAFLDASYGTRGDYGEYQADFTAVQKMLRALEDEAKRQAGEMQTELDVLRDQYGVAVQSDKTLTELKTATIDAWTALEEAKSEQTAAYERWGFEAVVPGLEGLKLAYLEQVEKYEAAQKSINDAILAGITTQSEIDSMRVTDKLEELRVQMAAAQAEEASLTTQLIAVQAGAVAAAKAAADAAAEAARVASSQAQKAVDDAIKQSTYGIYGSKHGTEAELLTAKAIQLNTDKSWLSSGSHASWLKQNNASAWTVALLRKYMLEDQGLTVEDWYKKYGKLEGFASGGMATPGWALVGEDGPELVNFASRAMVYPAEETSRILAAQSDGSPRGDNALLREQNQLLRTTIRQLHVIIKNTRSGRDILDYLTGDVEADGGDSDIPELKQFGGAAQ